MLQTSLRRRKKMYQDEVGFFYFPSPCPVRIVFTVGLKLTVHTHAHTHFLFKLYEYFEMYQDVEKTELLVRLWFQGKLIYIFCFSFKTLYSLCGNFSSIVFFLSLLRSSMLLMSFFFTLSLRVKDRRLSAFGIKKKKMHRLQCPRC